jgi:hypothetical protein
LRARVERLNPLRVLRSVRGRFSAAG